MANSGNNCCTFDNFFYNQIQLIRPCMLIKFLSVTIPRNVILWTCFDVNIRFLIFYLKSINLVFPAFMNSLLAFNQSVILFISI